MRGRMPSTSPAVWESLWMSCPILTTVVVKVGMPMTRDGDGITMHGSFCCFHIATGCPEWDITESWFTGDCSPEALMRNFWGVV